MFEGFHFNILYWSFGLLGLLLYTFLGLFDITTMPNWLYMFIIAYGFGGFIAIVSRGKS